MLAARALIDVRADARVADGFSFQPAPEIAGCGWRQDMPDPRIVFAVPDVASIVLEPKFTIQVNDESSIGVWSKPNRPKLIFSDHDLDGTLTNSGGAVAGAPGGHPLQLLFWGDWWNGPGATKCGLVEVRTRALLESGYFSELLQYGVPRAPVWRGSLIVTGPAPPSSVDSPDELMEAVLGMVEDLLEDDVFPDPDDGPRIVFIVLLPDTLTFGPGLTPGGAHSNDYDITFPWNDDTFWVGWIRPGLPVDPPVGGSRSLMKALSHEVVEILTDPEGTAWRTGSADRGRCEISDAGVSVSGGVSTSQTAFVSGVHVQSYWSVNDNATIIPIDGGYQAQLKSHVREVGRNIFASGQFKPTEEDNRFCHPDFPECCMIDKEYEWRAYSIKEVVTISVHTQRYRRTSLTWTINGHSHGGAPNFPVTVKVAAYLVGRTLKVEERTVTLECRETPVGLEIKSSGGNFAIDVGCAVRERDITGNLKLDNGGLVATPQITVGFNGSQLLYDDTYIQQKTACLVAMIRRYDVQYKPSMRIAPQEGINFSMSDLLRDIPAYVRPIQYAGMQWIARAVFAAQHFHRLEGSREAIRLMAEAPALACNVDLHALKAQVKSAAPAGNAQKAVRGRRVPSKSSDRA
jgi:hypothetical protein